MINSAFLPLHSQQPMASSSGVKPKRKRAGSAEPEDESSNAKHLRIVPPTFDAATGFAFPPELIPDMTTSATASESDQMMEDHDMDFDMDDAAVATPYNVIEGGHYSYAESGSGGFGFGPGAEEDEMGSDSDTSPKLGYAQLGYFPAGPSGDTAHHAQANAYNSFQAPLWHQHGCPPQPGAGAFSGIIQPAHAGPLAADASAVERARNAHGPQCTSIPKLQMSQYADATTGERSLWTVCQDCGACERAN